MINEIKIWPKVYKEDLNKLVAEVKNLVQKPALIFLSGEIGAGKTTFAQSFIGNFKNILSPTYSLIQECEDMAHADFYRMESPSEIEYLELDLYLENKNFFLVEWGKKYFKEIERSVERDFYFYDLQIVQKDFGDERSFSLFLFDPK